MAARMNRGGRQAAGPMTSKYKKGALLLAFLMGHLVARASEEIKDTTHTQVVVRQHPKTGKPYVSIVPSDAVPADLFTGSATSYTRPDYRMLDPHFKNGDIPYNGPVSDRKKVYVFAATLMTVGTVGGAVGMATAPAAAGTASGGAGAYVGAGAAVAGTATAASLAASKKRPWDEDFKHMSESKLVRKDETGEEKKNV